MHKERDGRCENTTFKKAIKRRAEKKGDKRKRKSKDGAEGDEEDDGVLTSGESGIFIVLEFFYIYVLHFFSLVYSAMVRSPALSLICIVVSLCFLVGHHIFPSCGDKR